MQAAVAHFARGATQGGHPTHSILSAIPVHPGLALVFSPVSQAGARNLIQHQLYGACAGYEATLLVDASCFLIPEQQAQQAKRVVRGVGLPPDLPLCQWVTLIKEGPLWEAVPPAEPDYEEEQEEEEEEDITTFFCTSVECLLDVNPEIRCDQCGRAFCSDNCKFQRYHFCIPPGGSQ
jgi:hypothetical protein